MKRFGSLREGKGAVSTESLALKSHPYSFFTRYDEKLGTNPEELLSAAHAAASPCRSSECSEWRTLYNPTSNGEQTCSCSTAGSSCVPALPPSGPLPPGRGGSAAAGSRGAADESERACRVVRQPISPRSAALQASAPFIQITWARATGPDHQGRRQ